MCSLLLILLSVVMFHHLGLSDELVKAVPGGKLRRVLTCPKCLTFWCSLFYSLLVLGWRVVQSLATSFTLAYLAMWAELLLSYFVKIYESLYEKINSAQTDGDDSAEDSDHKEPADKSY